MKSLFDFIVSPDGERYNNSVKVGDKNLILNTEIYNHQYVNRDAVVLKVPVVNNTNIKEGDKLVVHHNVFRRWYNVKGIEKNSRSFMSDNEYAISSDQIFLHKPVDSEDWNAMEGFCFVQPLKSTDSFDMDTERPLIGIVEYTDGTHKKGDLVGFTPVSEYEFIIGDKRLYRVMTKFITIRYEYRGDEEKYNPSWA
jgi:hypothetical protein|tara:strand:- start:531 stop:1118 length:588 start_codon:yes stop_codon:yes gene_type:complete